MGFSNLRNITRTYLSSPNPKRLFCTKNSIFTGLYPQSLKPTYDFPRFRVFRHSCLSSAQLWSAQNGLISFRVSFHSRLLCSETVGLDNDACYSSHTDVESTSDVDKMYRAIVDNSHAYSDLGKALDSVGVGLTTDLVAEILRRLRFEEKLAFRFFNWAGRRENYAHEPRVYSDMIDILSGTKHKIKQFRIVCEMLDYMKRHDKSAVPVEVLLAILRKYCEKYLTHVQKFAKRKRIRVKTQPEINAFNLLLDSLCKCGLVEDAEEMFKRMRKIVKPDDTTFNVLFFGWCRVREPTRAIRVLNEMIEMGLAPDNFTYIAAIDTFCGTGMVSEAVELFEFMRTSVSALSAPIAKTYAIMIVALIQNNRVEEGYKYLGLMTASGCLPDVSTYKELIEGMCLAGKIDMAYKFLEEMGNKGYPIDIVTYNCFLKVLCDNKHRDEALRLFGVMVEKGCEPSVQTYNMLITMCFEMGDPDGAIETWDEMYKRGCAQDIDTYCTMIEGFFGCKKVEDACGLLEEVVSKGMKLPYRKFDSFLAELSTIGDLRAIHRLSDHMRKFYNPAMARRFALNEKRRSVGLRGRK